MRIEAAVVVARSDEDWMLTTGGVRSMLNVADAVASTPSAATAVPVATCPAPSVPMITRSGQRTERSQAKTITTSLLFQPALFGAGRTGARIRV